MTNLLDTHFRFYENINTGKKVSLFVNTTANIHYIFTHTHNWFGLRVEPKNSLIYIIYTFWVQFSANVGPLSASLDRALTWEPHWTLRALSWESWEKSTQKSFYCELFFNT